MFYFAGFVPGFCGSGHVCFTKWPKPMYNLWFIQQLKVSILPASYVYSSTSKGRGVGN